MRRMPSKYTNPKRSHTPCSTNSNPRATWHGLVVHYEDGSEVLEKNNYWSTKHSKILATNWSEIVKKGISALELYWQGSSALLLNKKDLLPDEWVFSHTGMVDLSTGSDKPITLSRNIGFIKNGIKNLYRVSEKTGGVTFESDKA